MFAGLPAAGPGVAAPALAVCDSSIAPNMAVTHVEHLPDVDIGHLVVLAWQDSHDRLELRVVGERFSRLGYQIPDSSLGTNHGLIVDHAKFE